MLEFEDVEKPLPKPGEVLVRLKYAALNRRDVWITQGKYPGIHLPAILGSDGAGEIAEIGKEVEGLHVGQSVIINPSLHWGNNQEYYGKDFSVLGMPTDGTYADFVAVPVENIFPKPEHLSWEEAAALPLAGLTAYRALMKRGKLKSGETVVITGIGGGVALFTLLFAVAVGAHVFVISGSDKKIEFAKRLGAFGGSNYKLKGWVKELQQQSGGADLIVDGVGGSLFHDLIQLAKPGSRIITYGASAGYVPQVVLPKIFFKQLSIVGTAMGSSQDFAEMLSFINNFRLRPVIDRRFPLKEAKEAFDYMEIGQHFGKITLQIG